MVHKRFLISVQILLWVILLLPSHSFSAQIKRMDIFDKAGNSLLFVEFEYDSSGNNVGRSVYTADSTFLRRTVFVNEAGKRSKEISLNFNDDTIGITKMSSINNNPGISVFDQFNLDQFGAPVSYSANGDNTYNISQNGAVIYKMKYMFSSDGDLTRIEILSTGNDLLYYTKIENTVRAVLKQPTGSQPEPKFLFHGDHGQISINLKAESNLKVCMYNISGQLVAVPFAKTLHQGPQTVYFKLDSPGAKTIAGGLYIIRTYINGQPFSPSRKLITRAGGR
jgi:hypothetical protein